MTKVADAVKTPLQMALEATRENVVKSTKKESINEALVRVLHKDGQKLSRVELIAQISLDRLQAEHGDLNEEDMIKIIMSDEFKAINKTVKNGLDTSISRSNNNSSFHYNETYSQYKLEEVAGKFQITLRK